MLDEEGRPVHVPPSQLTIETWRHMSIDDLKAYSDYLKASARCTTSEHHRVCSLGEAEYVDRVIEEKRLEEIEWGKD